MAKVPDDLKAVLQHVLIECSSCDNKEVLYNMLVKDLGWGYWSLRGVPIHECPVCAGEDDDE